jgi:hypothetical protein
MIIAQKWTYRAKEAGRLPKAKKIEKVIVRLAQESTLGIPKDSWNALQPQACDPQQRGQ